MPNMLGVDSILFRLMVVTYMCVMVCPMCQYMILNWLPEEEKEPAMLKLMCLCVGGGVGFGVAGWLRGVYEKKRTWGLHGMLWRTMLSLDILLRGSESVLSCEECEA